MSLWFLNATAQQQITGMVTSAEDGLGIPGATVVAEGTTTGTTTDLDGNYSISIPSGTSVLVFSFVGMRTEYVPIEGRSVINIGMEPDIMGLEEVIVIAYGTTTRATYTGSASVVNRGQISGGSSESIDKSLGGKLAGVRIASQTGEPGSSGEVQIRGVGSIATSTQPLYVVDGVPMQTGSYGHSAVSTNVLNTINPEDIESITVLKDAAAASLYGSRAANGVILISTRRGQSGQTKFNLRSEFGWSEMASNSYEVMTGDQLREYTLASIEGWYLNANGAILPGSQNYGDPALIAEAREFATENIGDFAFYSDQVSNTNWRDIIYGTGNVQEYQLSASGGSQDTRFYANVGFTGNEGVIIGTNFDRLSGRLNLDHRPAEWLNFSLNQNLTHTKQMGYRDQTDQEQGIGFASPLGHLIAMDPTAPRYDADGNPQKNVSMIGYTYQHPDLSLRGVNQFNEHKLFRSMTNAQASVSLLPNLSVRTTIGIDHFNINNFEYWGPASIDGASMNGYGYKINHTNNTISSSTVMNFNQTLANVHNFGMLAGFESEMIREDRNIFSGSDYSTDKLPELGNAQPYDMTSSKLGSTILSYLGNLTYNFDNRYYLAGSLRTDGSSRLGADNRWGTFWSLSGSWRINREAFMSEATSINDLRLKASYGTNGTLPGDYYMHMGLYNFGGRYGNQSAIYVEQPYNPNLGWEKSENFNAGIEAGFFDRFSLGIEYYNKITSDLLLEMPTSYLTGFQNSLQNVGKIRNRGIEIEASSVNIMTGGGFTWRSMMNMTTLNSMVMELPGGEDIVDGDGIIHMYREGESMYSFYFPRWHGVDPESGLAQWYIDPDGSATADNLTYLYTEASRGIVGKAVPDIMGGLTNSFSFRGIEIHALVTYQFGGDMFDYPGYFMRHDNLRPFFNVAKDVAGNYWAQPGDVVDNPRPIYGNTLRPDRWSSRHVFSTDHIRLKELSLHYNLPRSIANSIQASGIAVFAKSTNTAMLWQKESGFDPEVPLNGYRTVDTPPLRSVQFGVTLDF